MRKFKVGDTVVRTTCSQGQAVRGEHYVVSATNGYNLDLEGHKQLHEGVYNYSVDYFELIQATTEQPAVLTPLEVAEAMLAGTELQFKRHGSDVWRDLPLRKNVVHFSTSNEYRKKPTTVLINGISVPAPAVVYNPSIMFYIDLRKLHVQHIPTRCIKADSKGLYWCTKEAAREALDAIMTSFSK